MLAAITIYALGDDLAFAAPRPTAATAARRGQLRKAGVNRAAARKDVPYADYRK
jgi:hypothetical protein